MISSCIKLVTNSAKNIGGQRVTLAARTGFSGLCANPTPSLIGGLTI